MNRYTIKKVKCPEQVGHFTGNRFILHLKINGSFKSVNVVAKGEPYLGDFGKGRKALYVDVYGYGFSGPVKLTRLFYVEVKRRGEPPRRMGKFGEK